MRAHRRHAQRVDRSQDVAERRPPGVRDRDLTDVAEVALFTDEVAAASAFYRDLVGADPDAECRAARLAVGGAKLLVHERADAVTGGPPNEDHVALAVHALDETCNALRASGIAFLVEPRDYPRGRSAYLRYSDGRLVELAQA